MSSTILKNQSVLNQSVKITLPVLLAYIPLGAVFGVLFVHLGYSWYWAPIMSFLIYGGSVQFMSISMMAMGAGLTQILIPAFMLLFRSVFYGLNFIERYKGIVWYEKLYLMHGLVDGTYALLHSYQYENKIKDKHFCISVSFLLHMYWVIGTFIGAFWGDHLPQPPGSFILSCLFLVVVLDQYFIIKSWRPIVLALIAATVAIILSAKNMVIIAIILCVISLICIKDKYLENKCTKN